MINSAVVPKSDGGFLPNNRIGMIEFDQELVEVRLLMIVSSAGAGHNGHHDLLG
jgi:hypothetical protein